MEYRLGMILGLATGLTAGILVIAILFRKKILDFTFDERQERARGVAFKYGFFTLLISMILYAASELSFGRWCDAMAGVCLCLALGITVFAVTCIVKDAYLSLKERPRNIMTLFALISAVNLCMGGVSLHRGKVVENGILTFRSTNLIAGITMLVVLVVYIVNFILRRGEEAE